VTLTFDLVTLKLVRIIARGVGNLPINFVFMGLFLLDLFSNTCQTHHDIATLTFDLRGHGACW